MKVKRWIQLVLGVVAGVALLLGTYEPLFAASPAPQASSWRGEYYANVDLVGEPAVVRTDNAIDFNWGAGAPASGLSADNFSVRWTRSASFDQALYRFWAVVDDGIRLYVDGQLVIDQWRDGAQRTLTADRQMAAGQHALRVEYYERGGQAVAKVGWDKVGASQSTGWKGEYYANLDLAGQPALVRTDTAIDFNWGSGAPASGLPADNFSVRWTRSASFDQASYRFWASVDDGVRLYVDGQLVIDQWRDGAQRTLTADRQMTAGQHTLRVEYYERGGQAVAKVGWDKVGASQSTGWKGEYYANLDLVGAPALVRTDTAIDFNWGSGAPVSGLPADNFSVRWTRSMAFDQASYRFWAIVDDGVRVYVDGALLIDGWRDGAQRTFTADRQMSAGQHALRVEYYERGGMAVARFGWQKTVEVVVDPSWRGEYYTNRELQGNPVLVRNDAELAFDWGQGSPATGIPSDNFSARWTRGVAFDAGTYRFQMLVDDGVRLWVDNRLILDAWFDHDSNGLRADTTLTKGVHSIKLEYYERIGNARIHLWWEKVSSPAYPDWKGEYWANRNLSGERALVRNDRVLDFSWGPGAPSPSLPVDDFSARWTRKVSLEDATYRFSAISDDGVRVWVDGRLLIDAWRDQQPRELSSDIVLARGTHDLKVEYYEHGGGARIRVWWQKVSSASYPDWRGEYWPNRDLSGTPTLVRNDREIDFSWGSGAPASGLPADDFSARWTRQYTFQPGRYRFYAWADDGVRVYLDGQTLLNEWHSAGNEVYTVDLTLSGTRQLTVEFYERRGDARIRFWWNRIGDL